MNARDLTLKVDKPGKRGIEIKRTGENEMSVKVPDPQVLLDLFGTGDETLAKMLLVQSLGACGINNPQADQSRDFMLTMIGDMAPRDAVERMLAVQMAATHASLMSVSAKMNDAATLHQQGVYELAFNRLARTFTAQAEALRKHRNGGQSKVIVEHVTVHEGGQAIVGQVQKG